MHLDREKRLCMTLLFLLPFIMSSRKRKVISPTSNSLVCKYAFRNQTSTYIKLRIPNFMKIQCCMMVLPLYTYNLSANLVFRLLSPPQTSSNPLREGEELNTPVPQILTNSSATGQDCKIKTDSSTTAPEPIISIQQDVAQVQYTHDRAIECLYDNIIILIPLKLFG